MKKIFLLLILSLIFCQPAFCADGDITETEVVADIVTWKLHRVLFDATAKVCVVQYNKIDANGKVVGQPKEIRFENVDDDPMTENIDETKTEFTDLINYINSNSNIKNSIKNAVQIKLGL